MTHRIVIDKFGNRVLEIGDYSTWNRAEAVIIEDPTFEYPKINAPPVIGQVDPYVVQRLMRDLKELRKNPEYRYQFSCIPMNDNLLVWHGNVRGSPDTAFCNMIFHLVLVFPSNYPVSPPKVQFCNYIGHPNVFSSYICLDMLEKGSWASEEEKNKLHTGWSSAYSVSAIMLQLQEFFSSKGYTERYYLEKARLSQEQFICTCGHNSVKKPYPPLLNRPKQINSTLNINRIPTKSHSSSEQFIESILPVFKEDVSIYPNILVRFSKNLCTFNNSHTVLKTNKTAEGLVFTISDFSYPNTGWHDVYKLDPHLFVGSTDTISLSLRLSGDLVYFCTVSLSYDLNSTIFTNSKCTIIESMENGNIIVARFWKQKKHYFLDNIKLFVNQQNLQTLKGSFQDLQFPQINSLSIVDDAYSRGAYFSFVPKEVIYTIFQELSSADLIAMSQTCRAFYKLSSDPLFWSTVQRKKNIFCFHTKIPFTKDTLGIGINFEKYPNSDIISSISSPLDLLSYTAFKKLNIRKSVWKEPFTHFLPVYINRRHAIRAIPIAKVMISSIFHIRSFSPQYALQIFPKLMNTMVVTMMNGSVHASMKALEGYCHFHRFFLHFVEEYPELLYQVNETIRGFIEDPSLRIKKVVPNLGEFLPYLTVTDDYSWEDIREAYLSENFDRNVKWIIEKLPHLQKTPLDPSSSAMQGRLNNTFQATQVSTRLLMFHVYFLRHIAKPEGKTVSDLKQMYDTLYGVPTHRLRENLQIAIKSILSVESWVEFFDRIDVPLPSVAQLYIWLCTSVKNSEAKRYHFKDGFKKRDNLKKPKPKLPQLQHDENDKYY